MATKTKSVGKLLTLKGKGVNVNSETELELLGTVRDFIGENGVLLPSNSNNLRDINKRLMLRLKDSEGNFEDLLTSPSLNRLIRSKEVSLREVMDYPIYLTEVKEKDSDGNLTGVISEQARIGVWQGEEVKQLAVKAEEPTVAKKQPTIESYEAFARY